MEFQARLRHLQASPQKVRLVADQIRGLAVQDAVDLLQLSEKRAARPLAKLVKSAIANAENRDENVDIDRLFVKEIFVDGGPALKRIWFTTMGRAYRKLKRRSHVTVKLAVRAEGDDKRGDRRSAARR